MPQENRDDDSMNLTRMFSWVLTLAHGVPITRTQDWQKLCWRIAATEVRTVATYPEIYDLS